MSDCLFCKIRDQQIPAEVLYSDEVCLAFADLHPVAPVHALIIPREHIATLNDVDAQHADILAGLLRAVPKVAAALGVAAGGYRLVANCNADAGQLVFHVHFHLLGGRTLGWPPG
jgi:histidine triad (HIT) family protein